MFKNILVPLHLEYKKNHEKLLTGALKVLDKKDGKISLLYVNENRAHGSVYPIIDEQNEEVYNKDALVKLEEIANKYSVPKDKLSFNIRAGSVHQEILDESQKIKVDAIVMMATKPGLGSYFISSTAERVIRHASCSVFVIRLNSNS
jgi:universal stress protein F